MSTVIGEIRTSDRIGLSMHLWGWAAAVALGYYFAAEAAFLIGTLSDRVFAPFWPPNAVLFCALLLSPPRRWGLVIAAAFPAHIIAELGVGMAPDRIMLAFASNCALALANAWVARHLLTGRPWFGSLRNVIVYLALCVGVVPALVAFAGAMVPMNGHTTLAQYWFYWSNWFLGNALAGLTLSPVILTWLAPDRRNRTSKGIWHQIEALLFVAAFVVACFISLQMSARIGHSVVLPAILYLPLPIILWGAMRFGERGGSGAILVLTVLSIWQALRAPGLFSDGDPGQTVLALQLFLIGIAIPTLLLTAAVDQLRRSEATTRQLVGSLLHAQDDERRRIARDLHDSVGQNLAAAGLLLSGVARMASADASGRAGGNSESVGGTIGGEIERLRLLLRETMDEVRTFSYVLHPPMLEPGGLHLALPTYVEGVAARCNMAISLHIAPRIDRLPANTELAIYRIVQEGLANITRHAKSDTAEIRLLRRQTMARDTVLLTIEDHGIGMQISSHDRRRASPAHTRGIGLQSMTERVQQLGGRLKLHSQPGRTCLTAIIPLDGRT
jgi:signal transduction histidine kinase